MKRVYGADVYNKHFVHDWIEAAEQCVYMTTPEQGTNECGFYAMKIACLFDGLKLVHNIKNKDVSATVLFSARTFFCIFCLACSLCCLFICSLVLSTGRPNTCTNWCFITTTSFPLCLGLLCCKTWSSSWAWAPRHSVRSLYRLLRRDGVASNRCAGLLLSSPKRSNATSCWNYVVYPCRRNRVM